VYWWGIEARTQNGLGLVGACMGQEWVVYGLGSRVELMGGTGWCVAKGKAVHTVTDMALLWRASRAGRISTWYLLWTPTCELTSRHCALALRRLDTPHYTPTSKRARDPLCCATRTSPRPRRPVLAGATTACCRRRRPPALSPPSRPRTA